MPHTLHEGDGEGDSEGDNEGDGGKEGVEAREREGEEAGRRVDTWSGREGVRITDVPVIVADDGWKCEAATERGQDDADKCDKEGEEVMLRCEDGAHERVGADDEVEGAEHSTVDDDVCGMVAGEIGRAHV